MKWSNFNLALLLLVSTALSACKINGGNEPNKARIAINQSHPSIAILGRRHISHNATEFDYVDCLVETLTEKTAGLNVIPEQQFIDDMYPYFEKSTAPLNVSNLKTMVKEPAFAKKLDDLNLRYLIWIDGKTQTVGTTGGVSCAIGPGGGGCLGFATWDDEADYEANIWDIQSLSLASNVNSTWSGTSYLPAIIIPIPLLANVQENACDDMAKRIERSI